MNRCQQWWRCLSYDHDNNGKENLNIVEKVEEHGLEASFYMRPVFNISNIKLNQAYVQAALI